MPFVQAKCTICGAELKIDSSKEAAICESCGNAFIVEKAINNYNTYSSVTNNINTDKLVLNIELEKERLNTSAETYIKIGNIQKALESYRELVDKFPDDWRGWWGTIYYQYGYKNAKELYSSFERDRVKEKLSAFKKLAPEEEFDKLDKIISGRIEEADAQIAKEESEKTSELKKAIDDADKIISKQVEEAETRFNDAYQAYTGSQLELEQAVKEKEIIEKKIKKADSFSDFLLGIFSFGPLFCCVVLGIIEGGEILGLGLFLGVLFALPGFIVGVVVNTIISIFIPQKKWKKELNSAEEKKRNLLSWCKKLESSVKELEKELEQSKTKQKYLAENREAIFADMYQNNRKDVFKYVDRQLQK